METDEVIDSSEIDSLVARAVEDEKPASKGRRTKKPAAKKPAAKKPKTLAEIAGSGDDATHPAPEPGSSDGLSEVYAKYGVGSDPNFRVALYRTYPKIAPGGVKFDGYYDEYDVPLSEQQIQADYGGGQYRVVVLGPNPKQPNLPRNYASRSVSIAGPPNYERVPRAIRAPKAADSASNNPPPVMMSPNQENPKLVEASMKILERSIEREREERRRVEDKAEARSASLGGITDAVADAERRRADDLIRAERERAESERRFMERHAEESRMQLVEEKRRLEMESRHRPTIGEELRGLAEMGVFNRDDGVAKDMLSQILAKHRDEMSAVQSQHSEFVKSLRDGHASEVATLRSAHMRELEAEREASRSREGRVEERLTAEREERERDRLRHREMVEDRDRQAKDRQTQALELQKSSFEARHQALVSSYETQERYYKTEIEKLRNELADLKSRQEEKGDIFVQLSKYKEMGALLKEMGGGSSAPSASTSGIGLSADDDWKKSAVEGLVDRAPDLVSRLFGGVMAQQQAAAPQQQWVEGQVHQTPQGPMEVVRNPQTGELALAPKAALDQHRAAIAQQQHRGLLGAQSPRSSAQPPSPRRSRKKSRSVVPDLSEGLPRPENPWEDEREDEAPAEAVPTVMRAKPEQRSEEPMELTSTERQALKMIAKLVHESVMAGDEPHEFVQKVLANYPAPMIKQGLTSSYTDEQIVRGVVQVEPNAAGATPGGRQFMASALALLRQAVSQ